MWLTNKWHLGILVYKLGTVMNRRTVEFWQIRPGTVNGTGTGTGDTLARLRAKKQTEPICRMDNLGTTVLRKHKIHYCDWIIPRSRSTDTVYSEWIGNYSLAWTRDNSITKVNEWQTPTTLRARARAPPHESYQHVNDLLARRGLAAYSWHTIVHLT